MIPTKSPAALLELIRLISGIAIHVAQLIADRNHAIVKYVMAQSAYTTWNSEMGVNLLVLKSPNGLAKKPIMVLWIQTGHLDPLSQHIYFA